MRWATGLLLAALATSAEAAGPWRSLFNGRDLSGWTPKITGYPAGENFAGTFRVEHGAIRVSYAGYDGFNNRFGHLFHERPVGPFRLRLEYRLLDPALADTPTWALANSGVMVLAQSPESMARDQRFPVSIEVQFLARLDDKPRPTGNLCTPGTVVHFGERREETHCINSASPTLARGKWVKAEVDVLPDGQIVHRINGAEVLRYRRAELDPKDPEAQPLIAAAGGQVRLDRGYIALQSEGHPIEFRRIEVQELE